MSADIVQSESKVLKTFLFLQIPAEATGGYYNSTLKPNPRAGVLVLRNRKNKHDEGPTVT